MRGAIGRAVIAVAAVAWLAGWAFFGMPWTGFVARPQRRRMIFIPFRQYSYRRRDLALNVLYYIPMGMIGMAFGWTAASTLLVAAGLSGGTELVQIFSTDRYPSATDVTLNVAGAAFGIAAVMLVRRAWRR